MVPGGGVLQLRDADPHSLASPTTITGTADPDTGNLAGLTFATPQVTIEREITNPRADVTIDATFGQVSPGNGVVDPEGNVTIQLAVAVDLHIEAILKGTTTPLGIPGDCRAAPINLTLTSAAPYDPEVSDQVTVATEDFTIPAVPTNTSCDPLIGDKVNDELAGAGHALSLQLAGELPVPDPVGCDTTTELVLEPADSSVLGKAVTFTAATAPVSSDPECVQAASEGKVLTGAVDFLRGSSVIGSDELDSSGVATFTTTGLPSGVQQLTARFRGNLPFLKSSDTLEHQVTVEPTVSTTLPDFLKLGTAVEFDYTITNSQFSAPLDDVRVDLTLRSTNAYPALERWDGAAWQPVTILGNSPDQRAALSVFDLASGAAHTERLRFSTIQPSDPPTTAGALTAIFEVKPNSALVAPAPTTGVSPNALAAGSKAVTFYNTDRIPSELVPYVENPVTPHTVRQGQTIDVQPVQIMPTNFGHKHGGYFEFLLDGRVVPVGEYPGRPRPGEEQTKWPAASSGMDALIHLPSDTPTGTREITVRYSGDALYLPSQATYSFTVLPARGPSYQCFAEGIPPTNFRVNVVAQANVPSSAQPGALDLENLDVTVLTDKSPYTAYAVYSTFNDEGATEIGEMGLRDIRYTFSGGGTGSATTLVQTNPYELPADPNPAPASTVDRVLSFGGETGSTSIAGEVGEIVPVTLETVEIDVVTPDLGVPYNIVCTPVGDPVVLGEVRVAGVDLSVSPGGPVRAGGDVTLTAETGNPAGAGVAEFVSGSTTLGVVPVVDGVAVMTTDALAPSVHGLSVRYFPQPIGPMLTSSVVSLEVLPELDCSGFAQAGNAAVVRLVYLELLGRCPDPAGFAHWKGRLDGGTSPQVFARSIARTPEAVARVVDDAYETMLGRAPDAPGRAFWVRRLQAGGRYDGLLADLASSGEFWSQAGSTRTGFVTRVYDRLLGRAPDAGGLDHWVGRLQGGSSPRAVVLTLANVDEPLGRLVAASYGEILGRSPNAGERAEGIAFLRSTGDRTGLYIELIGRAEFTSRAQGFPNPED